jgi:DNA-directed RNA polymerase specialized sigma24 family protein
VAFVLDSGLVNRGSGVIRTSDGSRNILDDPPPPKEEWALTREDFDRFLSWLDPDRGRAGERHEEIRAGLIRRFRRLLRHLDYADPTVLADCTINRVIQTLPKVIEGYVGRPEPYIHSVAYYIYREFLRRPELVPLTDADLAPAEPAQKPDVWDDDELLDSCLSRCLQRLTQRSREMILKYYRGERQVKIRLRKELAEGMGIKLPILRLKAQRVRAELKNCILDCMKRGSPM